MLHAKKTQVTNPSYLTQDNRKRNLRTISAKPY